MTLYSIVELVNFISGKFFSGQTLTPDRVNIILPDIQDTLYGDEINVILQASASVELQNKLLSTSILKPFKTTKSLTVSSVGQATLPSDYVRYLSAGVNYVDNTKKPQTIAPIKPYRAIEFVSEETFIKLQGSVFSRPEIKPFAKVMGGYLFIVPFDVTTVNLDYLRRPLLPYFDWCQDAANPNRIIYMPTGSFLSDAGNGTAQLNFNDPISMVGVILATNIFLNPSLSYPYTSKTVELEWDEDSHYKFVSRLLSFVGVNLGEADVEKHAETMKQQGA